MTSLGNRNFQRLADYVHARVGIRLPPSKRVMLEGRVSKRVRALGFASPDAYVERFLQGDVPPGEEVHLIDCVTTNKTDFYREPEHFAALREVLIPDVIHRRGGRGPHRIKLWSAAASIGAEAYTIAMLAADLAAERRDFDFAVLGTDVSTEVLARARRAVYPADAVLPVPADQRRRYVLSSRDAARREVRIAPEIRRLVRFDRLNLVEPPWPVDRDVDVIFCRNVLIYFDKATQARVVNGLTSHLRPGGYLVLGHSEAMAGEPCEELVQVRPTIFQHRPVARRHAA